MHTHVDDQHGFILYSNTAMEGGRGRRVRGGRGIISSELAGSRKAAATRQEQFLRRSTVPPSIMGNPIQGPLKHHGNYAQKTFKGPLNRALPPP